MDEAVAPTPSALVVPESDRRDLERLAVEIAVEAGLMIRHERPAGLGVHRTKATDLDVVTEMDERSETLIRRRLVAARPDDGILGEEKGGVEGSSGLTWVVDPIDGTVNYLYDLPAYAVSVAAVVGDPTVPGAWAPVVGVVVSPRTEEVFHASVGGGAHLRALTSGRTGGEAQPLAVNDVDDLGQVLLATGFGYDRDARRAQAAVVADLVPRVRDVRRLGAAALDLAHVAAGRVDAYYERRISPWDMAAGVLLVTEAGGVVSGLAAGSPPSGDMVVAGGPRTHGLVRSELARLTTP